MKRRIVIQKPKSNIDGVSPEFASGIYEMLKSGVRYFGNPGASLTYSAYSNDYRKKFEEQEKNRGMDDEYDEESVFDPKNALAGLEGERQTSTDLRQWMKHRPNAILIDSVHIKGMGKEVVDSETGVAQGGDTDHVLVIGNEVCIIDTKNWGNKGRQAKYTMGDNGEILRFGKPFPGGKIHMNQAIGLWMNYVDRVTAIVVIQNEKATVYRNINWFKSKFRIVERDGLVPILNSKYDKISEEDKSIINSSLIAKIAANAVAPYNRYEDIFGSAERINSVLPG